MKGGIGQLMKQAQQMQVEIDDAALGDDKEMLEDLIMAAFNDANRRVEETVKEKFSGMTAGLNLPGGFKLPF